MTYNEAYDKIITAYFRDEIKPYNGQFCFCGTLAGFDKRDNGTYNGWFIDKYSGHDLQKMEDGLLLTIYNVVGGNSGSKYNPFGEAISDLDRLKTLAHPKYEDALFAGMCAALEVLKEIHRSRGEDVDNVPVFTKRSLKLPSNV